MDSVIIDNCVVSKLVDTSIRICTLNRARKTFKIDVNNLETITLGNKIDDHKLLQELSDGIKKFDDLQQLKN